MTDADLLREAGDPTTLPERLRATLSDAIGRYASQARKDPALLGQIRTLVRNPALPLPVLGQVLLWPTKPYSVDAWHNPSVPLLLLTEPRAEYARAAAALVVAVGREVDDGNFQPVTDLARHLSVLLGPDWPEP